MMTLELQQLTDKIKYHSTISLLIIWMSETCPLWRHFDNSENSMEKFNSELQQKKIMF